jgi:hypothetical protein
MALRSVQQVERWKGHGHLENINEGGKKSKEEAAKGLGFGVLGLGFVQRSIGAPGRIGTRSVPGQYQVGTRSVPGRCQVSTRSVPGRYQVGARSVPGRCQVSTRSVPGQYQVGARSVPGRCQVSTRSPKPCLPTSGSQGSA